VYIGADIQKWKLMGKLLLYAVQANMHFLIATSMNCVNIRNSLCYVMAMSELLCNACFLPLPLSLMVNVLLLTWCQATFDQNYIGK
jgi:hypothetical protein